MHIQACGGGGLVSFPSWLLKPAPCNSSPHNSLLCPAAVVFLRAAVAIPSSGHISSTTHPSLAPGASALPPYPRAPTEAISISLAEQGLASSGLWSYSTGLGLALSGCEIPLKPRGFLLLRGKHAEGLSGLGSYLLLMSGRRKMEIFSMSLFAL